MSDKPKSVNKEIEKAQEQFDQFDKQIKDLTLDRVNASAKPTEQEPQTKLSQREIEKSPDIKLKPVRTIANRDKFNEKFKEDWEFDKQYVQFTAEHHELVGNNIEIWTRPYGGVPAEYWEAPTNKPVWGPRYLAEQLRKCNYHVFSMDERVPTGAADQYGSYTGKIIVDTVKSRLSANPVNTSRKSIFMGASGF